MMELAANSPTPQTTGTLALTLKESKLHITKVLHDLLSYQFDSDENILE